MNLKRFFQRRSPFCCLGFQQYWERRGKNGMSIEVHQHEGKPVFWLQMRAVDQDKEELYWRCEKARRLDKDLLLEADRNDSCPVTLWTETRILRCPWCGKHLESFYSMHWQTLFAPVPEHKLPGAFDESKYDILAKIKFYPTSQGGRKTPITGDVYRTTMFIGDAEDGNDCRLLLNQVGSISPGDEVVVPVRFLCPELALPRLKIGVRFKLWEGGVKGEGEVLAFGCRDNHR